MSDVGSTQALGPSAMFHSGEDLGGAWLGGGMARVDPHVRDPDLLGRGRILHNGRSESPVRSRLHVCCMATFDIDGIAAGKRIKIVW